MSDRCVVPDPPCVRKVDDTDGLLTAAFAWLSAFSNERTATHMHRWLSDTHLVYRVASAIKRADRTDPDPIDALFFSAMEVNEWRRVNGLPHYVDHKTHSFGEDGTRSTVEGLEQSRPN